MNPILPRIVAVAAILAAASAQAAPSSEDIDRLGKDLTPLGGERAGNADGTIPEWTGGITSPPAGFEPGSHHVDPYAGDQPLFEIDASNLDQHRDKLSVGHQRLIETYPTYRMKVFPTRRSASAPERIYEATRRIAATATLVDNGNGVSGATVGIPFPIPETGQQAIWNHLLRYRGENTRCQIGQAAVTRGGDYTLVRYAVDVSILYAKPGVTEEDLNNTMLLFKQKVLKPPRLAGDILLVHETMNQVVEPRRAWVYSPGQRRVRRAPNVAYDNPGTSSDGLRTADQFDMFNGAIDRYDWKLVGKREMYVPYNSYTLDSAKTAISDLLTPQHLNSEYTRYELHRVWVVDATLKDGAQHIYSRRTFYIDEDSWQILTADLYDNRDELWRVSEGHVINYYEMPLIWTALEVHTDLQAGRYIASGIDNDQQVCRFDIDFPAKNFTPAALRREGRR